MKETNAKAFIIYFKKSIFVLDNKIYKLAILFIFLISLVERILLVIKGGQFFIIDELRYSSGHHVLSFLNHFDIFSLSEYLYINSAHILFTFFCSICEFIRYIWVYFLISPGLPAFELNNSNVGIKVSSFIISMFSLLNILILILIVKKFYKSWKHIFIVSLLLSLSSSNLYFSRHLLPYDISITFALLSFYYLADENNTLKSIMLCGLFSSISTLLYFGYWYLSITTWFCFLLKGYTDKKILKYTIFCGLSGLFPIFVIHIFGSFYNIGLIDSILQFFIATKNFQMGDLSNGFFTFFEYFWYSENILFIFLIICYIYSLYMFIKNKRFELKRENLVIVYTSIILLILLIFSQILDVMVLYGRTIKPLIPFWCIIAILPSIKFIKLIKNRRYCIYSISFLTLFILIYNHYSIYKISFLKEFENEVKSYGISNIKYLSTINHNNDSNIVMNKKSNYIVTNTKWIIPPFQKPYYLEIPKGEVLLSKDSPYNYKPYQFLGLNKEERNIVDINKPKMLLIKQ